MTDSPDINVLAGALQHWQVWENSKQIFPEWGGGEKIRTNATQTLSAERGVD